MEKGFNEKIPPGQQDTDGTMQSANHTPTDTAGQLDEFAAALYEPDDLLEMRLVPSGKGGVVSEFCKASELPMRASWLRSFNEKGFHIYVSANPRKAHGGKAEHVALARSLFVDFDDNCTVEQARFTIQEAELPGPTMLVSTGHGIHAWWRLEEPLEDLARWTAYQKSLIALLKTDTAIHDPPRIMRVPGFRNWKPPEADAFIVQAQPDRQYPIHEFPEPKAAKPRAAPPISTDENGKIIKGNRHPSLTSLAGTMRRRGCTASEIEAALQELNKRCEPPLPPEDVARIAEKVARYEPAETKPGRCYRLTDTGNAERFRDRYLRQFRFRAAGGGNTDNGTWFVWAGTHWTEDTCFEAARAAKETVRAMYAEAANITDDQERKEFVKYVRGCESRSKREAMLSLAKKEPGIAVPPDAFDQDDWQFNCLTGTLDLRTGQLKPHDPDDLLSQIAPVRYEPDVPCPRFEKFLVEIMPDPELRIWLQRWLGFCLTGDIREQLLPIFYGEGNNGKNTLLDCIKTIMGPYACDAPPEMTSVSKGDRHPTEIADLFGRRLVVDSESEEGKALRIQFMKRITGDQTLKGRYIRENFFEFRRTHKTILVTNNLPKVKEQKLATWRRLRVLPFNVIIPDERVDKALPDKLKAEREGVLAWLVKGCLDWQCEGLPDVAAIEEVTGDYRKDQDPIREFMEARCCFHPNARVSRPELYKAYQLWADEAKEKYPLPRRTFYERIRGYEEVTEGQFRVGGKVVDGFIGIGLSAEPATF